MKQFVLLAAAATLLSACSETTGPTADLSTSSARPVADPGISVSGNLVNDSFLFEDNTISSASGSFFTVDDLESGGFSTAAPSVVTAYNNSTKFLGRIDNHTLFLVVPNGGSTYSLAFDLYIIGSWDGQGQQAQSGAFGQDIWRLGIRCEVTSEIGTNLLTTDFSNQLTVQQSYPMAATQKGGKKAGSGSYAQDGLGFRADPTVHTPQFRSFGDTQYHMSFSGTNPCGAGEQMVFAFTVPDAGLQSNRDESWGIDNVVLKTDT